MSGNRVDVLVLILALACQASQGDVMKLKDGRVLEGLVTDEGDAYRIEMRWGTLTFAKTEVVSVEEKPLAPASPAANPASGPSPESQPASGSSPSPAEEGPAPGSKPRLVILLDPKLGLAKDAAPNIDIVADAPVEAMVAAAPDAKDRCGFLLHVVPGTVATNAKGGPKDPNAMVAFSSAEDVELIKKEGLWGQVTVTVRYTLTLPAGGQSARSTVVRGTSAGAATQLKNVPGPIGVGPTYAIAGRLADLTEVAKARAVGDLGKSVLEELGKQFISSAPTPSAYYEQGFRFSSVHWSDDPKTAELKLRNRLPFRIRGKLLARMTWALRAGPHGRSISNAPVVAEFSLDPGQEDAIRFRIPERVILDDQRRGKGDEVPASLKDLSRVQVTELSIVP